MTKDVFIRLNGMQSPSDADKPEPVEIVCRGTYAKKNGQHYIAYEEVVGDSDQIVKNVIKIYENHYEVIKSGALRTHLCFEEGKPSFSFYETPYGNLVVRVHTKKVFVEETEEEIHVRVVYELEINYEKLADCRIEMFIQSKKDDFVL